MIDLCPAKLEGGGRLSQKTRCRDRKTIVAAQTYRVSLGFMGLKVVKGCPKQAVPKIF